MVKKFFYSLLAVATMGVTLTSCDNKEELTQNYKLNVTVNLPEGVNLDDVNTASVKVVNTQTGLEVEQTEKSSNYTFFLPGGTYTVTASMRINNGTALTVFSGSKSADVYAETSVALDLVQSQLSGLIFKEVYYNMVKPNGKTPYMRDQFFEIYNNSDETLYLDNCIIGMLEGTQGVVPSAWMEGDELMKEYALGYYTVAFVSESGKEYPLAPGKSVVVASQAQNHIQLTTEMYDGSVAGAMVSPVDLSKADYEVCLSDYKPAVAIDNTDVPNLTVIAAQGTQNYFMLPYTGNAIILAKLPVNPVEYGKDPANFKQKPNSTVTTSYLMIPQEYVLDGLNIVNNEDKASQRVIRLRSEVDAGMLFMNAPYMGKSVRRKVKEITKDGRAIFQDTNNSTEDFLREQTPTPGIIPTVVD